VAVQHKTLPIPFGKIKKKTLKKKAIPVKPRTHARTSTTEEIIVLFESDSPASSQPSQLPMTCLPCLFALCLTNGVTTASCGVFPL